MSKVIEAIEQEQMNKELPEFSPGDTVIVQVKVKEGTRERRDTDNESESADHGSLSREATEFRSIRFCSQLRRLQRS